MLLINKNTNNTLIVTITEKVSISNPYFLFVFTSDATNEKVIFLQENISQHTDRYDEFVITERSTNLDYTSGIIEFLPIGSWTYEIFEQASSTNLDRTLTGARLEVGKAKVIGTNETYSKYSGQPTTYKVHERQ